MSIDNTNVNVFQPHFLFPNENLNKEEDCTWLQASMSTKLSLLATTSDNECHEIFVKQYISDHNVKLPTTLPFSYCSPIPIKDIVCTGGYFVGDKEFTVNDKEISGHLKSAMTQVSMIVRIYVSTYDYRHYLLTKYIEAEAKRIKLIEDQVSLDSCSLRHNIIKLNAIHSQKSVHPPGGPIL